MKDKKDSQFTAVLRIQAVFNPDPTFKKLLATFRGKLKMMLVET
jgi:hypothetical protein